MHCACNLQISQLSPSPSPIRGWCLTIPIIAETHGFLLKPIHTFKDMISHPTPPPSAAQTYGVQVNWTFWLENQMVHLILFGKH